ncbi:hypothetical protein HOM50_01335 [bacterium]|jgi:hypothetical protein|nr:hypothetical protein [bacterium]MBT5015033.1 hypothetical protein [bacterium]
MLAAILSNITSLVENEGPTTLLPPPPLDAAALVLPSEPSTKLTPEIIS